MPPREIVTLPAEILRRKAREVESFDAGLQNLIDDMVETMRVAPGVGLAAPQINVPFRVITVEFGDEEDEEAPKKLFTLVNPEIARSSIDTVVGLEGCLSIPQLVGDVERANEVTLRALNRRGQPTRIKAKGWLARIFQHEIDHLNGILFTDIAGRVYRPEEEENAPQSPPENDGASARNLSAEESTNI
jgi:peptide deformylase